MPRNDLESEGEKQARRQMVGREIQEHLDSRRIQKDQAKELANEGLRLQEHVELSAQIQYSRMAVERLLQRLEEETTVEEVAIESGVSDVGQSTGRMHQHGDGPLDDDYVGEVLLLREGAAADCTNETMSVADYAAEPPQPPNDPDEDGYEWDEVTRPSGSSGVMYGSLMSSRMPGREQGGGDVSELICQEIRISVRKVHHSMFMAKQLMLTSPQWWGSRLVSRRINTFLLRANYHSRKVKTWSDKLRSRAFLQATSINKVAQEVAADMALVSRNHHQLTKKLADGAVEKLSLEKQLAQVRKKLEGLNSEKEEAQRLLMAEAHCKDPAVAETILLLKHLQQVDRLHPRCQAVRQWLVIRDTFQGSTKDSK